MPHGEFAQCPHCGKTAYGHDEIEAEFGYRFGGTKPQSWCRECRSSSNSNDSDESLSVWEASEIWASHGKDEDYTFGYSEEELEDAL